LIAQFTTVFLSKLAALDQCLNTPLDFIVYLTQKTEG